VYNDGLVLVSQHVKFCKSKFNSFCMEMEYVSKIWVMRHPPSVLIASTLEVMVSRSHAI